MQMLLHRNQIQLITVLGLVLLSWPLFSLAHAGPNTAGQTIEICDVTQGSLLFRTNQPGHFLPAPTLHTKVEIDITGLIARAVVNQEFTNPGTEWAEGVYVFPLPETAAVDHLRIIIGERRIEGMIQERNLAEKTYTAAKKQGRRASLLEQERPNVFTASVANIGPGETVTIEIEYQETLRYHDGQFHLRFPMVVGPRYISGAPLTATDFHQTVNGNGWAFNTDQIPDASRITPPVQHPDKGLINFVNLQIHLSAGFPLARLTSYSHAILKTQNQEGGYTITLKDEEIPGDRDFELTWEPEIGQTPQAAVFTEMKNDEIYSLVMVLPPKIPYAEGISQHREVIYVIDTSGSMHGPSLDQAKAAVTQALHRLTALDRFNIIQFNSFTHTLFSNAKAASEGTIQEAIRYVKALTAEGGTEMLPALKRALEEQKETGRLRQVIFLTDGLIGNETALFQVVQQQLGASRLFTIGIGSAPNSYFMRKAAEFGGGTFTYIGKTTAVEERMYRLLDKLEHPAMSNIQVLLPAPSLRDQVPDRIPDLYKGEPVMIVMKSDSLPGELTLTGQVGQAPWQTRLSRKSAERGVGIAVLWARQKIESLMNQQVGNQPPEGIRRKIIALALQHHLVSQYTSLVAVDVTPVRSPTQPLHTHPLKTNLPAGQDYAAIFGLAQGGTSGKLHVLSGLLCLVLAYRFFRFSRKPI